MSRKTFAEQNNGELSKRPPDHLGKVAAAMWRKVVPVLEANSPVKRIDMMLVEMYCSQYEVYRTAYDSIKEDGIQTPMFKSLQNSAGEIVGKVFVGYKRNPATSIFTDALKQLTSVGAELGLSPKSRADLMAIKDDDSGVDTAAEIKKLLGGGK